MGRLYKIFICPDITKSYQELLLDCQIIFHIYIVEHFSKFITSNEVNIYNNTVSRALSLNDFIIMERFNDRILHPQKTSHYLTKKNTNYN